MLQRRHSPRSVLFGIFLVFSFLLQPLATLLPGSTAFAATLPTISGSQTSGGGTQYVYPNCPAQIPPDTITVSNLAPGQMIGGPSSVVVNQYAQSGITDIAASIQYNGNTYNSPFYFSDSGSQFSTPGANVVFTLVYPPTNQWPINSVGNQDILVNATVFVYNSDGTPVLDANGAPVFLNYNWDIACEGNPSTPTNTPTSTPTNTNTPTNTPTDTPTNSPTFTPTDTPTSTATNTPTDTPTNTPTNTATNTPVPPTDTPTSTPTNTATNTPTNTPVPPTNTSTSTPTNTPTNTPTKTATSTPTNTPTTCPQGKAAITSYYYIINGTKKVTSLQGNVHQGDTVEVFYTIAAGCSNIEVSLVSYTAPSSTFNWNTANQQQVYQSQTQTVSSGQHSMTVKVPSCYFQIDFVYGGVIVRLGPAGTNNFYSSQNRLIDHGNGGTNSCSNQNQKRT